MERREDCLTLTLDEAAAYTGIGRHQLVKMQNSDRAFPSFKVGTKTLVDKKLLTEYVHRLAEERVGETLVNPVVAQIIANRQ